MENGSHFDTFDSQVSDYELLVALVGLAEVLCVELLVANGVFPEAEVYLILYYLYIHIEVKFQTNA